MVLCIIYANVGNPVYLTCKLQSADDGSEVSVCIMFIMVIPSGNSTPNSTHWNVLHISKSHQPPL